MFLGNTPPTNNYVFWKNIEVFIIPWWNIVVLRVNSKYLTWMRYILIFCDIWSFITTSVVDDHVCKIYIPNNYIYLIPEFYFFKCNVSKLTIIFSLQYIFSQKIINKKSFCVLDLHFLFHEFTFSFVPTNVHKIQNVPTHNDNWNGTWQCLAQIKTTPRIFIHKMKIMYIDFYRDLFVWFEWP